jgi:hypothetical protein
MKIERTQLVDELYAFAKAGSGVIIGPPGVGKSYALGELRYRLKSDRIPHLILPVERLGEASEVEIRRILKRPGDFVELLRSAVASVESRAILIFDGFDAARGERERSGILRLITRAVTELGDIWNTIVSVRTFDAKKSEQLLRLFPSKTETRPDSLPCRSFSIPLLNNEELEQVFVQVPTIKVLFDNGSNDFRSLLKIPFNLWLIEQALKSGAAANDFSAVTSEVQLLELYWEYRVRRAKDPEDREAVISRTAATMMIDHTLTVQRDRVYDPATRRAWEGLLSDETLIEVPEKTMRVAFTHNILFDFSVSMLLLDTNPAKFAQFVAEEPARPLFLRPSLVYHFTWLWHFDRDAFWENFWFVTQRGEAHLRQIVRLVLPAVIVMEARSFEDLRPLLARLENDDPQGIAAIAFTLQALRVLTSAHPLLWTQFIGGTTQHLNQRFAWDAGRIALDYIEQGKLNDEAMQACGEFGRGLLRWAWESRGVENRYWFERIVALIAIPLVAKTFSADPLESKRLFEQILQVIGEPGFPVDCIFRLANEIPQLTPHAPDFVGSIYERVFGHEEKSEEKTNIGGMVMPLISNRRQEFEGSQYSLLQEFPGFLARAPFVAIPSGIRAIQAWILRRHVLRYLRAEKTLADVTFEFRFRDRTAHYVEDGSMIWAASSYPERELEIIHAISDWLGEAAKREDIQSLDTFLDSFAANAQLAFLWAQLLFKGAEFPSILAPRLWELTIAPPILEEPDTLLALGAFLEKASPHFTTEQLKQLETAILHLPSAIKVERKQSEYRRDRLIARIPPQQLTTPEAIALRNSLEKQSKLQENQPLFSFETLPPEPYTEERYFQDIGAKSDLPANIELKKLYTPLKEWSDKGKEPTQVDSLIPMAVALADLLLADGTAEEPVKRTAWMHLSDFAFQSILIKKQNDPNHFKLFRKILLHAATQPDPEPDPERNANWNSASWSPAPRNTAAQILPWLMTFGPDREVLDLVRKLATDLVPSVRFLLATELWRLKETESTAMWEIVDRYVREERNAVVLYGLTGSLWEMIHKDKERSLQVIQSLLSRITSDKDDESCWANLIRMVVDYAIKYQNPWAQDRLEKWRRDPVGCALAIAVSGNRLIAYLQPGQKVDRFARARSNLIAHMGAIAQGLTNLQTVADPKADEVQKNWRLLYGVIDEAVTRFYFAADVNPSLRQRRENPLDDSARSRFFRDVLPVLEKVLSFGKEKETGMLLAPTAHHFMELLNGVIQYDPALVLRLAAEVIECSKRYGYNLDSLALRETVKLVESILVDYSDKVQDDASVKYLLNVLDAFVEVGWPEALNLVWRLDEVYR